jgi:hypothetical protein
MRIFAVVASVLALAAPAAAGEGGVQTSIGYAFSKHLEEGGRNVPQGAYLSLASGGRPVGIEADFGYHRDSAEFFGESIVLHTLTAAAGPRLALEGGGAKPFLHVLGGVRYDTAEGESNTALGGMAGGGIDIPVGSLFLRLGADFQIFFDEGEDLKTLRLNAGITF